MVGGILDIANALLKLANSGIGPVIVQFGLFTTALASLNKVLQKGNVFSQITSSFGGLKTAISGVASGATTLGAAFKGSSLLMSGGIVAAGMAIVGLISLVEKLNVTYEEQAQKVDELQAEYDSLYGEGGEMARLEAAEFLIDADQRRLDILKMQEASLAEQLRIAKQLEFDKFNQENPLTYMEGTPGMTGIGVQTSKSLVDKWAKEFDDLNKQLEGGAKTPEEYSKALLGLYDQLDDNVEKYREYKDAGVKLSDEQERAIAIAGQMEAAFAETGETVSKSTQYLLQFIDKFKKLEDLTAPRNEIKSVVDEINGLIAAGEIGSPKLEKIWGYLTPEKALEFGYDAVQGAEYFMDNFGGMISGTAQEAGWAFEDFLHTIDDGSGKMVEFSDTGTIFLGSMGEIARQTGLSVEALSDWRMTWAQFLPEMPLFTEEVNGLKISLQQAGVIAERSGGQLLKGPVDSLRELQTITGASSVAQLKKYAKALQSAGAADFAETEEELDYLLSQLHELEENSTPTITPTVINTQQVVDELNKIGALSGNEEKDIEVITLAKEALQELGVVDSYTVGDKTFYVDAAGNALGTLEQIMASYYNLRDKTVRIRIVEDHVYASGFASGNIYDLSSLMAEGGTAKGGKTLINDGKPVNGSAAEIVAYGGKAQIFNGGMPTVVDMPRGATVYNATDTQKILNSGINSFAGGSGVSPMTRPTSPPSSIATSDTAWSEAVAGATVSSAKTKEEYEQWLKEKKHALAMDEITEEQYYLELEKMNEEYVKNITDYQDEYWRNMEDIYKWRKQQQDELNGSLEQQIELERALGELAKTKENQLLVYKDGRMQYLSNIDAISEARLGVLEAAGGRTSTLASLATANYGGLGTQGTNGVQWIFDINNINLSEVTDVPGFIEGLKNLAYQYSYKRA